MKYHFCWYNSSRRFFCTKSCIRFIISFIILSTSCHEAVAFFPTYYPLSLSRVPSLISHHQRSTLLFQQQSKRNKFPPNQSTRTTAFTYASFKSKRKQSSQQGLQKQKQTKKRYNPSKNNIEKTVVILYHKPKNVIVSHSNSDSIAKQKDSDKNEARMTVYEDIMSMRGYIGENTHHSSIINSNITQSDTTLFHQVTKIQSKLHAIGRLDVDTTGLLLLTNDGGLVHHVTNPSASSKLTTTVSSSSSSLTKKDDEEMNHDIVKTYEALIMGYHTLPPPNIIEEYNMMSFPKNESNSDKNKNTNSNSNAEYKLLPLFKGVDIGSKYGGMTKPIHDLQVMSHPTDKSTIVRLSISEGKNRQVRRMFHAIGSGVMKLHRLQVGVIDLGMLSKNNLDDKSGECGNYEGEGCWRMLSEEEIWHGLGWKVRVLS